jgi:hypothetical protein
MVLDVRAGSPARTSDAAVRGRRTFGRGAENFTQGTKPIAVTVRTVGFADAETWTAPAMKK